MPFPRRTLHLATFNRHDEAETEVNIQYAYHPGCAAQTYGDPGDCWPEEPAEVEICSARCGREAVELAEGEIESYTQWLIENHGVEW